MKDYSKQVRITEIFHSLQGESNRVGIPTVFVRLTGCPLRCQYCDTAYAFKGGKMMDLENLLEQVASFGCKTVCVTGGEPLAQKACIPLLTALCDAGYDVSIETSGERCIAEVDPRVMIVMDIKTPGSAESASNRWSNLSLLKPTDQIKFVLCSREDYLWACEIIKEHQLTSIADLLFSPSWGQLDPVDLANWIIEDRLLVRFQLQLHKILWNDSRGR